MSNILIIDDEPGIRTVLSDILEDEGYGTFTAEDGFEGLSVLDKETVDIVILDIWLPKMGGIDVLKEIRKSHSDVETIVISGHANIDLAVKAVKLGAFDFLEKPLSLEKVITLIRNALKLGELKRENESLKNNTFCEDEIIGTSKPIMKIKQRIAQSSSSNAKILILGENGTGKELVARQIHRQSSRSEGPFIEVNCAAIPETLIESELFGHEKGAFTNAVDKRKGKFEMADGGTLFLDEIADMSLSTQAKVLRAIQENRFERVGGEKTVSVDVRIIAATNKDIQKEIEDGRFREDLYFRLNVVPINVPPLSEREEDVLLLAAYFFKRFSRQHNTEIKTISTEGLKILKEYTWPGNVRELKNFIERLVVMTDVDVIDAETVSLYLGEKSETKPREFSLDFENMKLNEAKDAFERQIIIHKLEENGYNISKTAQVLGIYPSNLHGKIKKLGIEIKR